MNKTLKSLLLQGLSNVIGILPMVAVFVVIFHSNEKMDSDHKRLQNESECLNQESKKLDNGQVTWNTDAELKAVIADCVAQKELTQ